MRVLISCFAVAMLFCAIPAMAQTGDADMDSNWELYYENDVAVGPFLERLNVVLTSEEYLGGNEFAAFIGEYLDAVGMFNNDMVQCRAEVSGDDMRYQYYESYEGLRDNQLVGQMINVPNSELRSANYVNMDDAMLYLGIANLVDLAALELEWFKENTDLMAKHPALANEGVGEDEFQQVFAMIEMMQIEEILRSTFNGELAIVLYGLPSVEQFASGNVEPADFDGAVMVGINDREYVRTMLDSFGSEVGLMKAEVDEGLDWDFYKLAMEESVGVAFNDEILIASPNMPALHEHMMSEDLGFDAPTTQFYLDLNVERLHEDLIHPALTAVTGMAGADKDISVPHEAVFYLFDVPEPDALGHFTVNSYTEQGEGFGMEVNAKKAVLTYELAYLATGLCVFAQVADIDLSELEQMFGGPQVTYNEDDGGGSGCGDCEGDPADCADCQDEAPAPAPAE